MPSAVQFILQYILESFLQTWPYLLLTIPVAVAVNMSHASRHIERVFSARPLIAILLATAVGAFSPLCSCSVIPVVSALLIGGVPLAPVMSFWLASPSMDPEIFFLSVSALGWELAVWRLATSFFLSLGGGLTSHLLVQNGWLGDTYLRKSAAPQVRPFSRVLLAPLHRMWNNAKQEWRQMIQAKQTLRPQTATVCCESPGTIPPKTNVGIQPITSDKLDPHRTGEETCSGTCGLDTEEEPPFWQQLFSEVWDAASMVLKFMLLAWIIGALIQLYVPQEAIYDLFNGHHPRSIGLAALLGVPVYTSNLTALPMIGELLSLGMSPASALAFLIAGPVTTLPAMSAVWGLVSRKVFALYIGFALTGAVLFGFLYGML